MSKILLIDDEASMREWLSIFFRREGHKVEVASNGQEALAMIHDQEFDVIFTDLRMPGEVGGLDVLKAVKAATPSTQVIVMTAFGTTETAIGAMKLGAYDYIEKPFKFGELKVLLEKCIEKRALLQENVHLRSELQSRYQFGNIIAKSDAMRNLFERLRKILHSKVSVLILGENGTGKELVARALHYNSPRRDHRFEAVNCAAVAESLWESEFFGHERGAFTGAENDKLGYFRTADQGSLFLDEIGEIPLHMQVKLLRALQEQQVRPVGGIRDVPVDVRIITATNKHLEREVREGHFREDLFFRLNVFMLEIPPLRQRREDIPLLANHFLIQFCKETEREISNFSQGAMECLLNYDYPGNVRELKNSIEYAVLMETSDQLQVESLPQAFRRVESFFPLPKTESVTLPEEGLDVLLQNVERKFLLIALKEAKGVRKEAARLLKISLRSFRYRLAKHEAFVFGGDLTPGSLEET